MCVMCVMCVMCAFFYECKNICSRDLFGCGWCVGALMLLRPCFHFFVSLLCHDTCGWGSDEVGCEFQQLFVCVFLHIFYDL